MDVLQSSLYLFIDHFTASFTVRLFVTSVLILCTGLAFKVWIHVVRLSFIDEVDLCTLEQDHPYIPNIKSIVSILVMTLTLVLVGGITISAFPPFDGPYEVLYLIGLFFLVGTAGILAEIHWGEIRWHITAFMSGSAVSLLFFVVGFFHKQQNLMAAVFFLLMLLCSLGGFLRYLKGTKNRNVPLIFILTFLTWVFVWFMQ